MSVPERIWAASVTENYGEWQTTTDGLPRPTEYVRADLATLSSDATRDALTELDQLRDRVKVLDKVLEPLQHLANAVFRGDEEGREMNAGKPDDAPVWGFDSATLTYGHLRTARRVREGGGKADG